MRACRSRPVAGLGPAGLAHTRRLAVVANLARVLDPFLGVADLLPVPRAVLRGGLRLQHRRLTEGAGLDLVDHYLCHVRSMKDLTRLRGDLIALSQAERADTLRPSEIRVPVLLLWGERDHLADIRGAQHLRDAVPASRLVVLDCGHCPQIQLPAEVSGLLMDLPALHHDAPHHNAVVSAAG
jgi:pimeloyl-ACP methyl ester carboxylesterase